MSTNIKIVEHVVNELPSERPLVKGEKYKVMQADGTLIEYVVNSQGEPVRLKGITNDESSRLNRLSSDQISKVESITTGDITKLKEDYTKEQIDTKIFDLGNLANSSKVSLGNSTVLPVPPQSGGVTIPNAWVELAQNVTYTQAGGSPITGIDGHRSIAEWDVSSWSLVDMGELPSTPVDGEVVEGDNRAVSGDTTYKALPSINTVRSEHQLFDKVNGWEEGGFSTTNEDLSTGGSRRTKYINIPDDATSISFTGLGTSGDRRIAYMSGENGTGTFLGVNVITTSNNTIPRNSWAGIDAKSFRFFYQRAADGDVNDSFMLNFGSQMEWEPYEYIQSINGATFLEKKPIEIGGMYAVLNGTSPTVNESGWYRATPVVDDVAMKGNTGLGYDIKRNLFIVSEYNTTVSSRLMMFRKQDLVDRNTSSPQISTPFNIIDLTEHIDHIQGCAWDFVDDTYLALGTVKGQATGGANSVVVKVSPVGTLIDIIPLGDNLTVQVGMIDILLDGNIIIKPNLGSSAYIFNRAYTLIDRKTLIGNEGICVNKYTGDIWCADDNFTVKKYDKNFTELATYTYNTFTNESSGSNVEGMCILPDGSLVISADAYLHGGTQLGNSLFFFDFEQTVNKRLYFYLPNGIGDYKNVTLDYTSEMILPSATITDVVVNSNQSLTKTYRSGTTKAAVANAAFSTNLVSNTVFQTRLGL